MKDILGFKLLNSDDLGAITFRDNDRDIAYADGSLDDYIENYNYIVNFINEHPYGCFFSCKRSGDTKWLPARPILNLSQQQIEGYLIFDEDGDGYRVTGASWIEHLQYAVIIQVIPE